MRPEESDLHYLTPSNKFYPPHIDESQSLQRTDLLTSKLPEKSHYKKVIIVEAQAGQGKTTLISQFLAYNNNNYIWYQIGPEDSDPVLLLSSLLVNLTKNLPHFQSSQLSSILNEGSVGPLDLTRCANILLKDLDIYLKEDIYFVFDDIHLIKFGTLTNSLLEHIIDTSPPRVHFVFASRHPLKLKCKTLRNGNQISYLNTVDLALNNKEIEELYNDILGKAISPNEAIEIQRITNGWVMGIILASHPISGRKNFWADSANNRIDQEIPKGHMLDYFQEEIFDQIPGQLHTAFLKLSFLHEIPIDFATDLTGIGNFGQMLYEMSRNNYFIYGLDDNQHVFRFHHFFQEFLQKRAKTQFSTTEISEIYNTEALYHLEQGMTEKALTCYKNGGDLQAMDRLLKREGMSIITKNRHITILTLLLDIPKKDLLDYSWLTLFTGLLQVDFAPKSTLPFFDSALRDFIKSGDETGELIALSQTIYFHFVISGQYLIGSKLLPRTETLLEKLKDSLPVPIIIMASRNLASGYCFFNGDMAKARSFISLATTLSTRHNIRNFIASSRFIQGYIELLSGNRAKYLREAEICFGLFNDPLVGESNKLTMRVMNLCYLSMTCDQQNYDFQQEALQDSINQNVVNQTVAAPYLFIWKSSNLFSAGHFEYGVELLTKGLGITSTASSDHMHSQLLQWLSFGNALAGKAELAEQQLTESATHREKAGGPFYTAFHNIISGATYSRLKIYNKAYATIEKGLSIAQSIPSTYLTICALFNRSYLKHISQTPEACLDDLEAGLSLMKINGYDHFWSWEPVMMTKLLGFAVKKDIEKSFAQTLARKRLHISFSDDGTPIPLLKFTLLDSFELSLENKVLFRARDLTPFQRELLGLLITAKGQRTPQEKVQLELWPDNSPVNARKSFDTLLTRTRKIIKPLLSLPVKEYIYIQKGILCLDNFEIDALQFLEAARIGLRHSKNGDWLQAHHAFQTAFSAYQGMMPEDTFKSEQVLAYNDQLIHVFLEFCTIWTTNLAETGRYEEATLLIEQTLQINVLDEKLTTLLYFLYQKNNSPLKANSTLRRYHEALVKAEYGEEEIHQYIDEIKNQTNYLN